MGYDHQTSPFTTRIFLTCYCLFLLVNVLLHSNNIYQIKKEKFKLKYDFQAILLSIISLSIFLISFFGLWFARISILCFIAFLFSILLLISLISLLLIILNVLNIDSKYSLYFAHNYIWLIKSSTILLRIINLIFSCLLNLLALWGICHLCSCIEYRHQSWPYRKRTLRISETII